MDRSSTIEFERALGVFHKAIYVYEMARWKDRIRQTTKDRMRNDVIVAAGALYDVGMRM